MTWATLLPLILGFVMALIQQWLKPKLEATAAKLPPPQSKADIENLFDKTIQSTNHPIERLFLRHLKAVSVKHADKLLAGQAPKLSYADHVLLNGE